MMNERVPVRNLLLTALIFLTIIISSICAAPTSPNNTKVPSAITCTKKGNEKKSVCCRPSIWTDILIFYTSNYFTHAATTRTQPGQSTFGNLLTVVLAFLFPMSGALRGVRAIQSIAAFADTDLQQAARAGALCMVVRVPQGDKEGRTVLNGFATKLHGHSKLPPDYVLMTVPWNATFTEDEVAPRGGVWKTLVGYVKPQQNTSTTIACSYNALKSIVAVLQTLFATVTLYNSKGHQIEQFGYAAFGLTVAPYALMSLINLCANIFCPEYSSMYLVSNQALRSLMQPVGPGDQGGSQEKPVTPAGQTVIQRNIGTSGQDDANDIQAVHPAEDQKQSDQAQIAPDNHDDQAFEISGTVGTLSPESDRAIQEQIERQIGNSTVRDKTDLTQLDADFARSQFSAGILWFLSIAGANVGIIWGLSGFHKGSSSVAERVWMMMWLSFGIVMGLVMEPSADLLEDRRVLNLGHTLPDFSFTRRNVSRNCKDFLTYWLIPVAYAVPAIGGLVVVGKMINHYGVCSVV